ncbi:pre-rRNA-processing protein pno1 [Paraphaeosphaeria minitans]
MPSPRRSPLKTMPHSSTWTPPPLRLRQPKTPHTPTRKTCPQPTSRAGQSSPRAVSYRWPSSGSEETCRVSRSEPPPTWHMCPSNPPPVPPHRMTPLKTNWPKIYPPLVEHLKLQVRMNTSKKSVEMRTSSATTDTGALQKGEDFVKAFCLGFDVDDAIALLRLDDLYIETFEIKDVKTLQGEHLGRAIGRIAGKDGKTKFAIENASRTRVVLADQKIHILGGFKNIHIAREAIVSLILGSQPGKVYGNLRTVAGRMKERF